MCVDVFIMDALGHKLQVAKGKDSSFYGWHVVNKCCIQPGVEWQIDKSCGKGENRQSLQGEN